MSKIKVRNPIVEIDGDEMTRIIWYKIRETLILPYLDIDLKYFDLSAQSRDKTDDAITVEAAEATKKYGVGVKCATITPDEARVKEFTLKQMWRSPNGTIFREPIMPQRAPHRPALGQAGRRRAPRFGDQYRAQNFRFPAVGTIKISCTPEGGGDDDSGPAAQPQGGH